MATPNQGIGGLLLRIFGSRNERVVRGMFDTVEAVNRLEPEMRRLSDKALSGKTQEFRNRLFDAFKGKDFTREEADGVLNTMLPEAFATVREASRRVVRTPGADARPMRHFDVQLIGGMVLHSGAISEMVTGEGKTLVATLAAYLNAIPARGVHIVTVNDYLARRDRNWMGPLYEFLGLTAGVIQNQQSYEEKRAAYACDITFGKDSEFGFDYLRDNMRWSVEEQVQRRGLYYAIVDEVDSVLIDEARTPLIISGPSEESTDKYYVADRAARRLHVEEHFTVNEKDQNVILTESGIAAVEKILGVDSLYTGENADWPHHISQALRAHHLFKRDVEYVSKGGEIIIVDEFTGRLMPGRRWSDGLHQAIEAKEGLKIKEEDQTLATVTYQNFFRLYKKLAGMTGTAMTEAGEFAKIYRLDVVNIPTNLPLVRLEYPDVVYRTEKEKFDAIEEEIVAQHATGRPILVGTISIEKSEHLSDRLKRRGIKHEVLNAKHHEREAQIVAQAGQLGRVTIATNMAGRGTDIVLGECSEEELFEHWKANDLVPDGVRFDQPRDEVERRLLAHWAEKLLPPEIKDETPPEKRPARLQEHWRKQAIPPLHFCRSMSGLGGLHIVGTERHEARRIDNQLRGRAGRQGDPGSSRFFLSLQDDLMRIFASDRVSSLLQRIGMEEGMAIESGLVTRSIERAQKKVEEHNFDIRKHLLEYDEVMDEQRKAIYSLRQRILENSDLKSLVLEMIEDQLSDDLDETVPDENEALERNGRPFCEWARAYGAAVALEEWKASDLAALKRLFAERKGLAQAPLESAARETVASALAQFADPEQPFFKWNLPAISRWARHAGVAAEAEDMAKALLGRVQALVHKAAAEEYGASDADAVTAALEEQAVSTYMAEAVAVEEWDVPGLTGWAEAVGITLPIAQWQQAEEQEAEGDLLAQRLDAARAQLHERLERQIKRSKPVEVVQRVAAFELVRRIKGLASDPKGSLHRLLSGLEKCLGVSVPESDAAREIAAERAAIQERLAAQLAQLLQKRSREDAAAFCAGLMVDTFLGMDLTAPGRNMVGFAALMAGKYGVRLDPFECSKLDGPELGCLSLEKIREVYAAREEKLGVEAMRLLERYLLLQKIDTKWKDHLLAMDHLKAGIGLRGYAQVDPKIEYTREGRALFDQAQVSIRREVTDLVLRLELGGGAGSAPARRPAASGAERHEAVKAAGGQDIRKQQDAAIAGTQRSEEKSQPIRYTAAAVGRNDPCPCGSGKKYKKCCGRA